LNRTRVVPHFGRVYVYGLCAITIPNQGGAVKLRCPRGSTAARFARPAAWRGRKKRRAVGRLRAVDYMDNRLT